MKELSIKEKAQAYDEAIKKVNDFYEGKTKLYSDVDKTLNYLFPELKESGKSKDERIRKNIIATIHLYYGEPLDDEAKEMIAWLEKQCEQKSINYSKQCADYKKDSELQMPRLTEFENELATILFEREYEGSTETEADVVRGRLEYELAAIRLAPKLLSAIKEQRSFWTEEDEKFHSRIYDLIHSAAFENYETDEDGKELGEYAKIVEWFNFIKDRVQPKYCWKPSGEQMEFLYKYAEQNNYDGSILTSLYNDLKKLKEE